MKARFRERWLILITPLLFCCLDVALTLGKQPPAPMRTVRNVMELNPLFKKAMAAGFGAEIGMGLLWILIVLVPTLLLPRFIAYCWSFTWAFGHAAAAIHWIVYIYVLGYWSEYWYCPLVAVIFAFTSQGFFADHMRIPAS